MRRTWTQSQSRDAHSQSTRHLSHALYKPGTSNPNSSSSSASSNINNTNVPLSSTGLTLPPFAFNSSTYHVLSHTPVSTLTGSEPVYGDVYPLLTGRCPEDVLTPTTTTQGFQLSSTYLHDEYRQYARSSGMREVKEKREKLKEKLREFIQNAPKKARLPRPIPQLVVGSKETREEWLRMLASNDIPINELVRAGPPHGLKGLPLFHELFTRGVSVVRAAWFIKLVYLTLDSVSTIQQISQRDKVLLEEWKKLSDSCATEMNACWTRPSDVVTAASTQSQYTQASVASFLNAIDYNQPSTYSALLPGLESKMIACGFELVQPLNAQSSQQSSTRQQFLNVPPHPSSNPPPPPPASLPHSVRFLHAHSRWLYFFSLFTFMCHDALLPRLGFISHALDSLQQTNVLAGELVKWEMWTSVLQLHVADIAANTDLTNKTYSCLIPIVKRCRTFIAPSNAAAPSSNLPSGGNPQMNLARLIAPLVLHHTTLFLRALRALAPPSDDVNSSGSNSSSTSQQQQNLQQQQQLGLDEENDWIAEQQREIMNTRRRSHSPSLPSSIPPPPSASCMLAVDAISLEDEIDMIDDD